MSTDVEQQNVAVIRALLERLNAGDVDGATEFIAEDLVDHNSAAPAPGRMGFKILHGKIMHGAFSDLRVVHEAIIATDDMVVTRVRLDATSTGPFMGIPPTGQPITSGGIEMYRLRDGIVVEHWAQFDLLGLMRQLGAIVALPITPPASPNFER